MDLEKIDRSSSIIKYSKTDNVLKDICSIINSARDYAFQSVNIALVERNWLIGYRIAEEELKGEGRADYGTEIIKKLSKELIEDMEKYRLYSNEDEFRDEDYIRINNTNLSAEEVAKMIKEKFKL